MAIFTTTYGAATSLTITLASLANGSSATSSTVDNTTTSYLDILVNVKVVLGASGVTTTGTIEVYAVGSLDNTNFDDVENDRLIGVIDADTSAATQIKTFSIASSFGGSLPPFWKIRVYNNTGSALAASGQAVSYRGITISSA